MPLVYLDTCALQRPLDDPSQHRVRVEAEAITAVLAAVDAGAVDLATSPVLRAEASQAGDASRREFAARTLALASLDAPATEAMRALALTYEAAGLKPFDALHLAAAVTAGAAYFCTTDDRFARRAQTVNTATTVVVDPLALVVALDL